MGLIITLILVGILLIIAEIILIPGIFLTGLIGLASLVASCFVGWEQYGQTGGIITIIINIVLLSLFLVLALRSKTWRKLSLSTNIDSKSNLSPIEKGINVGMEGLTLTRLAPMGKVLIGTQSVEAISTDGIIDPQSLVEVTLLADNKIYVKLK
ncbi:MAG: NfeD family protein [Bacteroidales bacterium]|nr:NfeD family protein [Bacteroidales bacterium]